MLECTQVQKNYGHQPVLRIPSLRLEKGIYWLQGSNGSGKTTFLRMVSGLLPFQGDIILDGHSQHRQPVPYRRSVSWADAEPLYPDFLRGQDLLSFYQEIRKAPGDQVRRLTDIFGVQSFLPAPIGTYSSGMTKKLSLLLAFIGRPSLIALDEPLVTLDRDALPALYSLIRESWLQEGTSFLISSHQDLERDALPEEKILRVSEKTIIPNLVPA